MPFFSRGAVGAPCPAIKVDTDHEEEEEEKEKFNKGQTASQIAAAVGRKQRRGPGFQSCCKDMTYSFKGQAKMAASTK